MLKASLFALGICFAMQGVSPEVVDNKPTALIPRETLLAKPDYFAVHISNKGDKIAYLARKGSQIELVVEANGKVLQRFDVNDSRDLYRYKWSPNDDLILILQDTNGDQKNHVIALDLKHGTRKDLTPGKNTAWIDFFISEDEILISNNKRNPQWFDVYRVNIKTGEMKLVFENNKYSGMLFDKNLKLRIAMATTKDGGIDIYKDGKFFKHTPKNQKNSMNGIIGDNWYYLSYEGRDKNALIKHNLKTDESEVLFTDEKSDISYCSFKRNRILVETNYLKPELHSLGYENDLKFLRSKSEEFRICSTNNDATKWIVAFYSSTKPSDYYLYDVKKQSLKFLFNEQKSLLKYKFHKMEPIVIKSRDGLDLVCYLTRGDSTKKLIMHIHGGPWSRDSYRFYKEVQLLANRGYSILQVNYRGSLGFGKKFTDAANMNFDKIRNDIIDVANWAIENGIADKDKIAIMGHSFGGYSALAGLTFTPDFFCCGVDTSGPSNWLTLEENAPASWKPHKASWYKLVGDPSTKEGREFMLKNSPALYAKNIKKPLIIFQGERDTNVDKGEAERMVAAMEKHNIPVRYIVYPDEGHIFMKEANQISYMAITEEFLAKTLGGWYEKMSAEEIKKSSHKIAK